VQLVSRQIMRVTIPSCVQTVQLCENGQSNEYVAVYAATPYGVTNHLHVPIHKRKLSPEEEALVKKVVADEIKALKLPPRDVTVSAADSKVQKLQVTATCADDECSTLSFIVTPTPGMSVRYQYNSDPRLLKKSVRFYAVPTLDGKFLGDIVPVASFPEIQSIADFSAIGGLNSERELMRRLGRHVGSQHFKDGPPKLKIVYYMQVDGQAVSERLADEIEIVATLLKSEDAESKASVPPPQNPAGGSAQINDANDCGCGGEDSTAQAERVPQARPAEQIRIPARLAQFPISEPTPVLEAPVIDSLEDVSVLSDAISQRFGEIEAQLVQVAEGQAALQTAIAQAGALRPELATAQAGQSAVNVHINQAGLGAEECCDESNFPMLHRAKVETRECWRNVRDQIPCN
jgi:hypothetical protein